MRGSERGEKRFGDIGQLVKEWWSYSAWKKRQSAHFVHDGNQAPIFTPIPLKPILFSKFPSNTTQSLPRTYTLGATHSGRLFQPTHTSLDVEGNWSSQRSPLRSQEECAAFIQATPQVGIEPRPLELWGNNSTSCAIVPPLQAASSQYSASKWTKKHCEGGEIFSLDQDDGCKYYAWHEDSNSLEKKWKWFDGS